MLRSITSSLLRPVLGSSVAVATSDQAVAFTFDDGPDPEGTPAVLATLRAHGARATFFVLGERVTAHPELTRRVLDEGHELALHSHTHRTLSELSPPAQYRALARGRRALALVAGAPPRLFRAPYGIQTPATVAISRILRMQPVMWSAYAAEWTEQPLDRCVEQVEPGIRPGGIVLLHDGSAGENRRPRRPIAEVAELVDRLLRTAAGRGLEVVPVGELLRRGAPQRRLWFRSWRM